MRSFLNLVILGGIKLWHVVLTAAIALLIGCFVQLIVAPIQRYKAWKQDVSVFELAHTTDSISHLLSFQQAQLKAAAADSIYLVVSMPESTLTLYVKGVGIYSTSILQQSQSSFLTRLKSTVYQNQFSRPQRAQLLYATVEKEPVKVKIAPKNVEEAAKMAIVPDSVIFEPAFVGYQLENGTIIRFSPENETWRSFKRNVALVTACCLQLVGALFQFQIREYQPEIKVRVNNKDLTAIYRAIPHQPYIIVYY